MGLSKGIDAYMYLSGSDYSVTVSARGNADTVFSESKSPEVGAMQHDNWEINQTDLKGWGALEKSGRYTVSGQKSGQTVISRFAEINPLTGNLCNNDLGDMLNTSPLIGKDVTVSYGFYDAGTGKKHQSYMYVTENYENWMRDCLASTPALAKRKFGTFVLPGSHDAGMFCGVDSEEDAEKLLLNLAASFAAKNKGATAGGAAAAALLASTPLLIALAGVAVAAVAAKTARRTLIGFGYTQKDNIDTQLRLGTRYFDFRPGYSPSFSRKDDKLRHQHGFIPGCEFSVFLSDVTNFLKTHPSEIVVVHVKFDGFHEKGMEPTDTEVDKYLLQAVEGTGIELGTVKDLDATVEALIVSKKRLIVLREADKCKDSYGDDAYATDNPQNIIDAITAKLESPNGDTSWTVLQLQGTYTNKLIKDDKKALAGHVTSLSDASSPLLSTKARFDHATYPWLVSTRANVAEHAGGNLLVLLNDFVDNALTSHAWALTKRRCG